MGNLEPAAKRDDPAREARAELRRRIEAQSEAAKAHEAAVTAHGVASEKSWRARSALEALEEASANPIDDFSAPHRDVELRWRRRRTRGSRQGAHRGARTGARTARRLVDGAQQLERTIALRRDDVTKAGHQVAYAIEEVVRTGVDLNALLRAAEEEASRLFASAPRCAPSPPPCRSVTNSEDWSSS